MEETEESDQAVREWVKKREKDFEWLAHGRVRCRQNGREFVPRLEVLEAFVNGKRFKKLQNLKTSLEELKPFEPFFVRSKNFEESVYCTLTGQLIGVSFGAVKMHMEGKRFKKAKESFMQGSLTLKPEPEISDLIEMENRRRSTSPEMVESGDKVSEGDAMDIDDGLSPPASSTTMHDKKSCKRRIR